MLPLCFPLNICLSWVLLVPLAAMIVLHKGVKIAIVFRLALVHTAQKEVHQHSRLVGPEFMREVTHNPNLILNPNPKPRFNPKK